MKLKAAWRPRITEGEGTVSTRLADALADDILQGRLSGGDRLPAHRCVADELNLAIGTVTKAFAILERRGLIATVRGSGTFVAFHYREVRPQVNLAKNAPPAAVTESQLRKTLVAVSRRVDRLLVNEYPPVVGYMAHRQLMAHWFEKLGMAASPENLLLTNGAQHALFIAFSVLLAEGGTLFVERNTFPGTLALAKNMRLPLVSVQADEQGMIPASFEERLLECRRTPRRVLYLTPTRQNPTTATMSAERRSQVVALCRQYDVAIVEDDVYASDADVSTIPLAVLAPERTFYVNSLSKALNPALRIGGLAVPSAYSAMSERAIAASASIVSPINCAVMEQWISDGTAQAVAAFIRQESLRRSDIARTVLGTNIVPHGYEGYHIWVPMGQAQAKNAYRAASKLGIALTPPESTRVDSDDDDWGIRICLGIPDLTTLNASLTAIAPFLLPQNERR